MTSLPDWLVERALLDEVPPANRERVERADPRELAERVAALRADNAAELSAHPAAAAVSLIESRIAGEARRLATQRRRRRMSIVGIFSAAAAGLVLVVLVGKGPAIDESSPAVPTTTPPGDTRVKGTARLLAFRQVGEHVERLEQDALVRAGDVVQLRYNAGGQRYGVIASVDGAGVVTLHYPVSEDAPPQATALAARPTALPHAYELDDAPRFERFFFFTADGPIDVPQSLASLRSLARRTDADTATPELTAGVRQWSLRLRKPERPSTDQQSPTP
jgi:hypothetical protein